jgi:hypothetical protein
MGKQKDTRTYMQKVIAQQDLRQWHEPPPGLVADEPLDPDNQRECMEALTEEFCLSLEDCVKNHDMERVDALMARADHLMQACVDFGYELMRPMAEHHAAILHQLNRAERRYLIRRYLTGHSVDPAKWREALDLYPTDSPEHREDLERVHAKIKDPKFRMVGDVMAKAKAISERPLHDEAYLRKLCGRGPK